MHILLLINAEIHWYYWYYTTAKIYKIYKIYKENLLQKYVFEEGRRIFRI